MPRKVPYRWQTVAYFFGLLCVSSIDWARLDPAAADSWLHYLIGMVIGGGLITIVARFAFRRAARQQ